MKKKKKLSKKERRQRARERADRIRLGGDIIEYTGRILEFGADILLSIHPMGRVAKIAGLSVKTGVLLGMKGIQELTELTNDLAKDKANSIDPKRNNSTSADTIISNDGYRFNVSQGRFRFDTEHGSFHGREVTTPPSRSIPSRRILPDIDRPSRVPTPSFDRYTPRTGIA